MGSDDATNTPRELTGEEKALYDRQIRLWGLEAQRKLASSHVLLVGTVSSLLGQELAKNVVLSGVARLALCAAGKPQSPAFLGPHLQATDSSLRDMNPHVNVAVLDDVFSHVHEFTIVCAIGMTRKEELAIASVCRDKGVAFSCGRMAGAVGWLFIDLGETYNFQMNVKKDPKADTETGEMKVMRFKFCSYADAIAAPWGKERIRSDFGWHVASTLLEFEEQKGRLPNGDNEDQRMLMDVYEKLSSLKKPAQVKKELIEQVGAAAQYFLPPVAAIVGGMWAKEVIKFVSGKDEPINNFFFFNSKTSSGSLELLGPAA